MSRFLITLFPKLRKRRGFFLIEAILAIVIMSISLTLIIQSLMSSMRAAAYSADYTRAIFFIDDKMFDLIKERYIEAPQTQEGAFSEEDQKYRFRLVTERTETSINRVLLDVFWGFAKGKKENALSITTYLFHPPEE